MAKGFMTRRSGNPPNPSYEVNMIQFFAMPGSSGKIRLKVQKPSDSDGVMIRQKSSAWVSGNTKDTGTLVATITDDTNYSGGNQWYEVSGFSDGIEYHFKAFPYKGDSYNEAIGVNETVCKAGGLLCEITADSISGSTANDTSGNANNGTISGIAVISGKVANEFSASGANQYVSLPSAVGIAVGTAQTIACWIKASSLPSKDKIFYLKMHGAHIRLGIKNTGELFVYNGVTTLSTGIFITAGNHYMVIVKWNGSNQLTLKVRDADDTSWSTYTSSSAPASASGNFNLFGDGSSDLTFNGARVDQFRVLNRLSTDDEDSSYWNGGVGC